MDKNWQDRPVCDGMLDLFVTAKFTSL